MAKQTWTVNVHEEGLRLDKFLAEPSRLGSRARAVEAIARGKVFVNDGEMAPRDAATRLKLADRVGVWMDRPGSSRARPRSRIPGLDIVFEDTDLLVVNKPAGLLTVPLPRREEASSVYDFVETYLRSRGKRKPMVVHRIDRDTSGLVVFAKHARAQAALKEQFLRREPERVYLAVVHGHPDPRSGTWRDRLVWDAKSLIQRPAHAGDPRGREAISEYRVIERFEGASLVEVRLVTGKRNQIRLQARLRGHPLVGEVLYTDAPEATGAIEFPRQALHAFRLSFLHPADGRPLRFEAPLPEDMRRLVEGLGTGMKNEE